MPLLRRRPARRPGRPQARRATLHARPGLGRAEGDREDGGRAARGRRVGRVRQRRARPRRSARGRGAASRGARRVGTRVAEPARPHPPVHRRGVPREPARRPRGLDRRRARRGRHDPPGVPQRGALGGALYDAHARSRAARPAVAADRHGIHTHRFFMPSYSVRRPAGLARGDRALVADVVRPHGPHAGLQGLVHGDARRRPGLVRAFRRQRPALVPRPTPSRRCSSTTS